MGQKVNPHGFRVGVIMGWDSRWFAANNKVGDLLVEDYKIRKYLKETLYAAGIPKIEIERNTANVKVFLHCGRPGMVIGKNGQDIERHRLTLEKMIGKPVALSIIEVKSPDLSAQLVAESIAAQLEKRVSFRRALKQSMGRAMRFGARGIKTQVSGRLGGAEIARTEHYHEGTIPLQTIRADIDYGFTEAKTTYGRIGVKVWIYKGEVLQAGQRMTARNIEAPKPRSERRDRPDRNARGSSYGDKPSYGDRPRQGGYNSGRSQQGGYNSGRPQQGGYNSGRPQQGGSRPAPSRPAQSAPRPAAPASPTSASPKQEGGDR